jgi:hypothetical protein
MSSKRSWSKTKIKSRTEEIRITVLVRRYAKYEMHLSACAVNIFFSQQDRKQSDIRCPTRRGCDIQPPGACEGKFFHYRGVLIGRPGVPRSLLYSGSFPSYLTWSLRIFARPSRAPGYSTHPTSNYCKMDIRATSFYMYDAVQEHTMCFCLLLLLFHGGSLSSTFHRP